MNDIKGSDFLLATICLEYYKLPFEWQSKSETNCSQLAEKNCSSGKKAITTLNLWVLSIEQSSLQKRVAIKDQIIGIPHFAFLFQMTSLLYSHVHPTSDATHFEEAEDEDEV